MWDWQGLPQLASASRGLADEDDDGEDLGPVQPPHAVQPQGEHAVDPLWDADTARRCLAEEAERIQRGPRR